MSNALATVFYDNDEMRTVVIDRQMWWSIIDVCNAIEIKNSRDVYKKLDEDEKDIMELEDAVGRKQKIQIINEFGLYHILLTARSEKAKPFRRWVTHEVLPRIRKYGYYKLSTEERKLVAYKKIAKLRGEEELEDNAYSKMSADMLELKVKIFESQDEFEIERADTIKKFPYTYDEMDKLCDYDLEFIKSFVPQEERDKYYKILKNGEQWYSEKFKKEIPKFMKKGFGKPIKSLQNRK